MISRYALYDTAGLSNHFNLAGLPKGVRPSYNISPTSMVPVIVSRDGEHVVERMIWGLVPQGAKNTNSVFRYKTFNVPSEKIFSRHSWERAVRERRCLVPANGYFDLNNSGKKRAFYIGPQNEELVAFAGIYSSWVDPEGCEHGSFSIITIESNADIPLLSGRMPVIIPQKDQARWLNSEVSDMGSLYDMLRQYPAGELAADEVSGEIHSLKANDASLIQPI